MSTRPRWRKATALSASTASGRASSTTSSRARMVGKMGELFVQRKRSGCQPPKQRIDRSVLTCFASQNDVGGIIAAHAHNSTAGMGTCPGQVQAVNRRAILAEAPCRSQHKHLPRRKLQMLEIAPHKAQFTL